MCQKHPQSKVQSPDPIKLINLYQYYIRYIFLWPSYYVDRWLIFLKLSFPQVSGMRLRQYYQIRFKLCWDENLCVEYFTIFIYKPCWRDWKANKLLVSDKFYYFNVPVQLGFTIIKLYCNWKCRNWQIFYILYFDQISWNIPWSSVILKVERCHRFPPKCIKDEVKTQKAHNNL